MLLQLHLSDTDLQQLAVRIAELITPHQADSRDGWTSRGQRSTSPSPRTQSADSSNAGRSRSTEPQMADCVSPSPNWTDGSALRVALRPTRTYHDRP
jgi:hypothetical protein